MDDFTLLNDEQIFESSKLKILKIRGINTDLSDFAILLGGKFMPKIHKENGSYKITRAGDYWTSSVVYDGNYASVVEYDETKYAQGTEMRNKSVRVALPFSSFKSIPSNGTKGIRASDRVLEIEYGYYPQSATKKEIQVELERLFKQCLLEETNNVYTTDSCNWRAFDDLFTPIKHIEYRYNGKRYIRVMANSCIEGNEFELSNGEKYINGNYVWIEIEPVKWWVDEESQIMITEKSLFAGVQYNYIKNRKIKGINHRGISKFEETCMKEFLDNYFARDIVSLIGKMDKTKMEEMEEHYENKYGFEFENVSEEDIIRSAVKSNVAVFLHGKPGCGKSDRVRQLDSDFIELNLSHLDIELLDGLAGERDGKAVHIKPAWLEELEEKCSSEPDKLHILFLEEITNASPLMQSKAYGIALDKKVAGRWKLPENARVVAAGNELEDSLAANEIAEPLYDRFAHVNIETTVEEWLKWAVTPETFYERIDYEERDESKAKIHPAIYAYIAYKGEEALRTPYSRENPQPHADPRRWKMASDMLYASNNPYTLDAIIGHELTSDFISFCKIQTITIEDILQGNYSEDDLEMNLGRKLATISGLVKVDEENMPKIRKFVKLLGPEMCKKFEVQWAGGNEERLEQLQEIRMIEREEENKKKSELLII